MKILKFNNLTDYSEWLVSLDKNEVGKDDLILAAFEQKGIPNILICGSPLAYEPIIENTVYSLFSEWNKRIPSCEDEYYPSLSSQFELSSDGKDIDMFTELRDSLTEKFEECLGINVLYLSTEY